MRFKNLTSEILHSEGAPELSDLTVVDSRDKIDGIRACLAHMKHAEMLKVDNSILRS